MNFSGIINTAPEGEIAWETAEGDARGGGGERSNAHSLLHSP